MARLFPGQARKVGKHPIVLLKTEDAQLEIASLHTTAAAGSLPVAGAALAQAQTRSGAYQVGTAGLGAAAWAHLHVPGTGRGGGHPAKGGGHDCCPPRQRPLICAHTHPQCARCVSHTRAPRSLHPPTPHPPTHGVPAAPQPTRRAGSGAGSSARPTSSMTWGAARRANALGRDFTVNSLLYEPFSRLIYDYTGGMRDAARRTLRTIGDAEASLVADPVRMLRAVRCAARAGVPGRGAGGVQAAQAAGAAHLARAQPSSHLPLPNTASQHPRPHINPSPAPPTKTRHHHHHHTRPDAPHQAWPWTRPWSRHSPS